MPVSDSNKVSGFSPKQGYPQDAAAGKAATGGAAATIAPLAAAAAASGHPEGSSGQVGQRPVQIFSGWCCKLSLRAARVNSDARAGLDRQHVRSVCRL